jgi:hypothetical protein
MRLSPSFPFPRVFPCRGNTSCGRSIGEETRLGSPCVQPGLVQPDRARARRKPGPGRAEESLMPVRARARASVLQPVACPSWHSRQASAADGAAPPAPMAGVSGRFRSGLRVESAPARAVRAGSDCSSGSVVAFRQGGWADSAIARTYAAKSDRRSGFRSSRTKPVGKIHSHSQVCAAAPSGAEAPKKLKQILLSYRIRITDKIFSHSRSNDRRFCCLKRNSHRIANHRLVVEFLVCSDRSPAMIGAI